MYSLFFLRFWIGLAISANAQVNARIISHLTEDINSKTAKLVNQYNYAYGSHIFFQVKVNRKIVSTKNN